MTVVVGAEMTVPAATDDVATHSEHRRQGVRSGRGARCAASLALLARRVASGPQVGSTQAEWATIVTACQSLTNTATAVQDVAITRLAAIEEEWLEDGTTTETPSGPGYIALGRP